MSSGCLHIYTGNGKGKTTAALGVLMRTLGAGQKAALIQFDKGNNATDNFYSERTFLKDNPNVDVFCYGCSRINADGTFRMSITEEDKQQAQKALSFVRQILVMKNYNLIILDEVISAAKTGLITQTDLKELIDIFRKNRFYELIMTGRGATEEIIKMADLITEMKCVKHYMEHGRRAKKGIDF